MDLVIGRMNTRAQRDAERALRRPQENYLRDRKERLKRIQKNELLKDEMVLKSIRKLQSDEALFLPPDVDDTTGEILTRLGSFFADDSTANIVIQQIVGRLADNDAFIEDRYYGVLSNPIYESKLDLDPPGVLVETARSLKELLESDIGPDSLFDRDALCMLDAAFEAFMNASILLRFVDERNAKMEEYANADGSNLLEDDLKMAWLLHRAWIRTLHLRSLEMGPEKFGWNHLDQIMRLGIALHIAEMQRAPMNRQLNRRTPVQYGGTLEAMHREYITALCNVTRDLKTETRRPGNFSSLDTLLYNMSPARFLAIITERIDRSISDESDLLAYLMSRYSRLEHVMDEEHVEDVLMSKRIVIKDENFATYDAVLQEDYTHETIYRIRDERDPSFDYESRVRKISQINRERRNYLLLRDWSKKRPWKQLYEVCYVRDKMGWRQGIRDFYKQIKILRELEKDEKPSPSSYANVWSSIWPIHPIASHDEDHEGLAPFRPRHFEDGCVICCDTFALESNAPIVVLHCDHIFHLTCIRELWDHESNYQTRCPICRSGGGIEGWYLHEAAGIYPEALDLFDNRVIAYDAVANRESYRNDPAWRARLTEGQQLMETDPDLESWQFRGSSHAQYEQSVNFDGESREPEIEMIHYRRRRRAWNQKRREKIRSSRKDLTSEFGPPEVEDEWTGPTAEQILQQQQRAAQAASQQVRIATADAAATAAAIRQSAVTLAQMIFGSRGPIGGDGRGGGNGN